MARSIISTQTLCAYFLSFLDLNASLLAGLYQASLCDEYLHGRNFRFPWPQAKCCLATILVFDLTERT